MAKDKVTSNGENNQELGKVPETMQERVSFVQADMYRFADSLDVIKRTLYEADEHGFAADLIPPMLKERAVWIRERAYELFRDIGVDEPAKTE